MRRVQSPRVRTAGPPDARTGALLAACVAAPAELWWLSGVPGRLTFTQGGFDVARALLSRVLTPALTYESAVPAGTVPLVWKAVGAAQATMTSAAAAMSLALPAGAIFGLLASSAWWADERTRGAGPFVAGATRLVIALLRSIHELLWAVLLLAAF